MGKYRVTVSLNEVYEIEADSEHEAIDEAHGMFKKICQAMPSEFEVEEIDGDDE